MHRIYAHVMALALALTLYLPGSSQAGDVYEFGFQSAYTGPHCVNLYLYQPWTRELLEKSNGRLKIDFFMSGAIVKLEDTAAGIMLGNPELGGFTAYYIDSLLPYSQALNIPHLSRDSVHATELYLKAYEEIPEIREEMDKMGKVFGIWGNDRAAFFSTKGPILSPDDLRGKRVLFWAGSQSDQIRAWGGIPVQVSPNDTYMGLQRGMGDVLFAPLPVGVAYKIMEIAKDITPIPAYNNLLVNFMNWDVWHDLPDDLKELFETSTRDFSRLSGELLYVYTNKDVETMKAEGCTFHALSDAQYQAFKDADRQAITDFWEKELARLGIKDPKAYMAKMYALSASISDSTGNLSVKADMQPVNIWERNQ